MGIPSIETKNRLTIATNRISPRAYYRAENLCYQNKSDKKLKPQFCKIVCLIERTVGHTPDCRLLIRSVLTHGMCIFEDGTRAARRREYERRA
mgnify:CR=1 FL=1